jgi:hypothetical protein
LTVTLHSVGFGASARGERWGEGAATIGAAGAAGCGVGVGGVGAAAAEVCCGATAAAAGAARAIGGAACAAASAAAAAVACAAAARAAAAAAAAAGALPCVTTPVTCGALACTRKGSQISLSMYPSVKFETVSLISLTATATQPASTCICRSIRNGSVPWP